MKTLPVLFILIPLFVDAQPNPKEMYTHQLMQINQQLETDSLNSNLSLWRAYIMVEMMSGSALSSNHPFQYFSQECQDCKTIQESFDFVDHSRQNRQYYLSRMRFYDHTGQAEKALADALYLIDSLHYSNEDIQRALPGLYIRTKQYDLANELLDTYIDEEKQERTSNYYTVSNSQASYVTMKLRLLYELNKQEEHLELIKQLCLDNFNYYLKESNKISGSTCSERTSYFEWSHDNYLKRIKSQGFYYLGELIKYCEEYKDTGLAHYQSIHQQMFNPNKKTMYDPDLNMELSDAELKTFIEQL